MFAVEPEFFRNMIITYMNHWGIVLVYDHWADEEGDGRINIKIDYREVGCEDSKWS